MIISRIRRAILGVVSVPVRTQSRTSKETSAHLLAGSTDALLKLGKLQGVAVMAKREEVSSPDEVGNHGLIQDPSPEPGLNALIRQWPAVWNGWREWL